MNQSFNLADNLVGGFESIDRIDSAHNAGEMAVALQQAIGYFGAIALNPLTAGAAIAANAMATTATLGKILGDFNNKGKINYSDLGALAGHTLIIAGAVALSINPISRVAVIASGVASGIGWIGISGNLIGNANASAVSPTLGTTPDPLVKTIIYVDPLILDLDGDGLEITPLSAGVLFDTNGDGIKKGTAWAGADDAMLVWDRNGNGSIDSGRELFGDETVLANGQKAAHGFEALAELDAGSLVNGATVGAADGVFDAKDARYGQLRLWRDLNQDGISQASELKTLTESGVVSIQLVNTQPNTNYGDAILSNSGTFTRTDGSAGQAGSFILAQNNFVRSFAPMAVSTAAQALPGIQGSGWVRDLQEAAGNDDLFRWVA